MLKRIEVSNCHITHLLYFFNGIVVTNFGEYSEYLDEYLEIYNDLIPDNGTPEYQCTPEH
jgi:hypothetical protein